MGLDPSLMKVMGYMGVMSGAEVVCKNASGHDDLEDSVISVGFSGDRVDVVMTRTGVWMWNGGKRDREEDAAGMWV